MQNQQEWYYADAAGQQAGPTTLENLRSLLANNTISGQTLVWKQGMDNWLPASAVPGLIPPRQARTIPAPAIPRPTGIQPRSTPGTSSTPSSTPASFNPYSTPKADPEPSPTEQAPKGLPAMLFSFEGRIPRRAYWGYTILVLVVFYAVIFAVASVFGEKSSATTIVGFLLYIPLLWSTIAIQCKRWHDRDKSGWWYLIGLLPIIGGLWVFIECGCLRGTFGINSYGEDPT